jgi:hypothetical protein
VKDEGVIGSGQGLYGEIVQIWAGLELVLEKVDSLHSRWVAFERDNLGRSLQRSAIFLSRNKLVALMQLSFVKMSWMPRQGFPVYNYSPQLS